MSHVTCLSDITDASNSPEQASAQKVGHKMGTGGARQHTCWCFHARLLQELLPDSSQPLSLLLGLASQQLALPLQLGPPLQSLCLSSLSVLPLLPFVLLTLPFLLFFLHAMTGQHDEL